MAPAYFEVSFGQATRSAPPPSTAEPLQLEYRGEAIRLAGRIDRIDTGRVAGELVFNVLDYKTGEAVRFSVEAVQRGLALQLPLYAMAVVEVVFADRDCVPWQAGYWYLADNGFRPKQALRMYHAAAGSLEPEETWEAMRGLDGADGRRAGPRHEGRAVSRLQQRCPLHRLSAPMRPSAASTRSVPWRRHGSRRSTSD